MQSAPPKIRTDVVISRHAAGGGTFYVLKDPASGNFFRLREVEEFIARQFDGDTPLEVVRLRVQEKYGASLAPETLQVFAKTLQASGLLDTGDAPRKRQSRGNRRISGSLLYLRFKLLDPDKVLGFLGPRVSFFFTPLFVVLAASMIALASLVVAFNGSELIRGALGLYHPSTIPAYLALAFAVISAHEFAHGLTCRHFGGGVREMGFMLIYFQPALYCNVSDAWLFPERRKRLWVGFAGPLFELFLWSVAVFAWRVTDVDTWVSRFSLIVIFSSGLKTLLNFNPFVKLDGYYLLSDYLEIPNLRKRSFRYVGDLCRRAVGLDAIEQRRNSKREARAYLAYGLVAMLASLLLLASVLFAVIGSAASDGQSGVLALVTVGFVGLRMHRWLARLFGRPTRQADDDDEGGTTSRTSSRSGKRMSPWSRWLRRLAWMAATAAGIAALFHFDTELRIAGAFQVLPAERTDIRPRIDGVIERVFVTEGTPVRTGDLIARLSGQDLRTSLQKTESELREVRSHLKILQAGPTRHELEPVEASVARVNEQLKLAQRRLERADILFREGALARNTLEDTRAHTSIAVSEYQEAKARLNAFVNSVRPEQIEATVAQIDRLETQRRHVQDQLQLLDVTSPASGVIGTPARQLRQMVGQAVATGGLIASVYELRDATAEITVSEKEIADVREGQSVEMKARADPDNAFWGKVIYIATSASGRSAGAEPLSLLPSSGGRSPSSVLIAVQIDNPSALLKPEMTGEAKVHAGRRRLIDLVVRRLARTFRVEFWSWW